MRTVWVNHLHVIVYRALSIVTKVKQYQLVTNDSKIRQLIMRKSQTTHLKNLLRIQYT